MKSFSLIITRHNDRPYLNETMYRTLEALIDDVATGQVDAQDIEQILTIDQTTGTVIDHTRKVALEVWRTLDAENSFAWREMRDWLESFSLDCDHLTGETGDLARDFYGQ